MSAVTAVHVRDFPGTLQAVGQARAFVAGLVAHLGPGRAPDVELCASELAANAVLHSMSGAVDGTYTIRVEITPGAVALTVSDMGPTLIPRPRRPSGESGRGLSMVGELSDRFTRCGCEAVAVFHL